MGRRRIWELTTASVAEAASAWLVVDRPDWCEARRVRVADLFRYWCTQCVGPFPPTGMLCGSWTPQGPGGVLCGSWSPVPAPGALCGSWGPPAPGGVLCGSWSPVPAPGALCGSWGPPAPGGVLCGSWSPVPAPGALCGSWGPPAPGGLLCGSWSPVPARGALCGSWSPSGSGTGCCPACDAPPVALCMTIPPDPGCPCLAEGATIILTCVSEGGAQYVGTGPNCPDGDGNPQNLVVEVNCPNPGGTPPGWNYLMSWAVGVCDFWSDEAVGSTCELTPFPWTVPVHINLCCQAPPDTSYSINATIDVCPTACSFDPTLAPVLHVESAGWTNATCGSCDTALNGTFACTTTGDCQWESPPTAPACGVGAAAGWQVSYSGTTWTAVVTVGGTVTYFFTAVAGPTLPVTLNFNSSVGSGTPCNHPASVTITA